VLGLHSTRDPRLAPPAPWTHSDAFESWSLHSPAGLDAARLRAFLDGLSPQLLRAKGVLHLAHDPLRRHIYQRVGRRASLAADAPWGDAPPGSSLVLIGPRGCVDGPRLQHDFTQLAADAAPLQ